MEKFDLNNIFQGISTLLQSDPSIMYARIGLILLGILLVYLGRRGILEPLVMIPMGLGMAAVNAGVLIMPGGVQGNLFLDPMVTDTDQLMNILQIDFLQPVYTFTFSNGLIACLIFMGIERCSTSTSCWPSHCKECSSRCAPSWVRSPSYRSPSRWG